MTRYEFTGDVYYNGNKLNILQAKYSDEIPKDISRADAFLSLLAYYQVQYELSEDSMLFLDGEFYYQVGENEIEKYDALQECLPFTLCKMAYESDEKWIFTENNIPEMAYYKKYLKKPFTTDKFKKVVLGKLQEKRAILICVAILLIGIGVFSHNYFIEELPKPAEVVDKYKTMQEYEQQQEMVSSIQAQIENGQEVEITYEESSLGG